MTTQKLRRQFSLWPPCNLMDQEDASPQLPRGVQGFPLLKSLLFGAIHSVLPLTAQQALVKIPGRLKTFHHSDSASAGDAVTMLGDKTSSSEDRRKELEYREELSIKWHLKERTRGGRVQGGHHFPLPILVQ